MSPPLQALYVARELEQRRRDTAFQALQQAERRLAQTLAQGRMLRDVRQDTQQRHGASTERALAAQQVATLQGFTARLDDALRQHEAQCEQSRLLAEQCRTRLTHVQLRLSVLDKLIERRAASRRQDAARREARDLDERVSAAAARAAMERLEDTHGTDTEPATPDRQPGLPTALEDA
jgi:flagellar export protein FliJ